MIDGETPMMNKEKTMRYRGFEITSNADYDIHRMNRMTGDVEVCKGYYCEVYDAKDVGYVNMLDEFCLAEGYEISDCSYSSLVNGIAVHVDNCYNELIEMKSDNNGYRVYLLLGKVLCWLGENETGKKLYNTFSEVLGLKNEEILRHGFSSLVPYFDRNEYAETIADYLIDEGTQDTVSGNIHFPFSEINERFAVDLPTDKDMLDRISEHLYKQSDIVSDFATDEDFDLMFFTAFCPNCEDRFAEDDQSPTMEM